MQGTEKITIEVDDTFDEIDKVRTIALGLLKMTQRIANEVDIEPCVMLGALITGSAGMMTANGHERCALAALEGAKEQVNITLGEMSRAARKQ